jgi:hypothetical protein
MGELLSRAAYLVHIIFKCFLEDPCPSLLNYLINASSKEISFDSSSFLVYFFAYGVTFLLS